MLALDRVLKLEFVVFLLVWSCDGDILQLELRRTERLTHFQSARTHTCTCEGFMPGFMIFIVLVLRHVAMETVRS